MASWLLTIGSPPVRLKSYDKYSAPLNVASDGALSASTQQDEDALIVEITAFADGPRVSGYADAAVLARIMVLAGVTSVASDALQRATSLWCRGEMFSPFCDRPSTIEPDGMVKQVKGGYLLRHKKRLFGKAWREEWVVLYEDSTLAWFKEKGRGEPEGCLVVKDAPEMLAVSQWTLRIPGRPDLPNGCHVVQLMAFGNNRRDKVHWLLAQSEDEVNDWMTAISNTLPPPPQPLKPPDVEKVSTNPLDPITPRLPPVPFYPAMPGEVPIAYSVPSGGGCGGVCFPQNGYSRPLVQAVQPAPINNTTIVVRDRPNCGAGDFTSGVVVGAALNNWGHGWGGGWGWGLGYAHSGGYYHNDTGVHINNHYDVNNTVINNDVSNTSISYVNDDYGDLGFDDADYGMDCGGDFGF